MSSAMPVESGISLRERFCTIPVFTFVFAMSYFSGR